MAFTSFLANELIDHLLGTGSYTSPSIYVSLHTGDPGDNGASEVSGNNYARVQHSSWAAASSKTTDNTGAITFPTPSGSWGTVTHFGIWDAASAGNFLMGAALSASKTIGASDPVSFPDGDLDVTFT